MHHDLIFNAIIQARLGSSRFPGKVLSDINGKHMLQRVIERLQHSNLISKIIVATTCLDEDDELALWCEETGIDVYRGSSSNVPKDSMNALLHINLIILFNNC